VNLLDVLLVVALVTAAVGGWRLGFVTRATSWLGMAAGLLLAAWTLPWVVDRLQGAEQLRVLLTAVGILLAGASIGQLIGLVLGGHLRLVMTGTRVRRGDRLAGAAAGVTGVVLGAWLLLPAMAEVPEWPAEQARGSRLAQVIDGVLPDPPDALGALGRVIGEDRFPRVFAALQPAPDLGDPPPASGLSTEVVAGVTPSIVRVEGRACANVQVGTGTVVGDGLVVTNAHVVAGEEATTVERDDGARLDARVVAFDGDRDLAVLAVPGLDRPPLPFVDAPLGTVGGVFGHPDGGPLRVAPFEVARRVDATGTDIYDEQRTTRDVLIVSAALRPGDSGGPLVDATGRSVGVAFAIAPDDPLVAYALSVDEVAAVLAEPLDATVDTGACLR
jgi:S1-C subfamily serine protease